MNKTEIELNGIYEGKSGEHRKVIKKDSPGGWQLRYQVVANSKRPSRVGFSNLMFNDTFATWAKKRIA